MTINVLRLSAVFTGALTLAALPFVDAAAEERHYIKKNEVFCDSSGRLCLDGSLWYLQNSRLLRLKARIRKQTGPGVIRMRLVGNNRLGDLRRTQIMLPVRGAYSEIVTHDLRPDAPDVADWRLTSFEFTSNAR